MDKSPPIRLAKRKSSLGTRTRNRSILEMNDLLTTRFATLAKSQRTGSNSTHSFVPRPAAYQEFMANKRVGPQSQNDPVLKRESERPKAVVSNSEGLAEDTRVSWVTAVEFVNVDGGIVSGCFGDIKKFCKNGKLDKVAAIIMSCTQNAMGDLTITLTDLSGGRGSSKGELAIFKRDKV
ncbi:hypothetical protein Tco_0140797 [Tanacetum coccineum]